MKGKHHPDPLTVMADRKRLEQRIDEFADNILPAEGFGRDQITDAMIRTLCSRFNDPNELMERVKGLADLWFVEPSGDD